MVRSLCHQVARFGSLQVANVSSILARYPEALIAGAPFPDYLYACGTDHGAGRTWHQKKYLPSALCALPLGECNKREFGNCPVHPARPPWKKGFPCHSMLRLVMFLQQHQANFHWFRMDCAKTSRTTPGEDAHWHTFHAKAAKYIREKHRGKVSGRTQRSGWTSPRSKSSARC